MPSIDTSSYTALTAPASYTVPTAPTGTTPPSQNTGSGGGGATGGGLPTLPTGLPTLPTGTTVAGLAATATGGGLPTLPTGLPTLPTGTTVAGLAATAVASLTSGAFADSSFKTYLTSKEVPPPPVQGSASYNSFLKETGITAVNTTDFSKYFEVKSDSLQTLVTAGLDKVFGTADYKQGSASSLAANAFITTSMVLVGTVPNQTIIGGKADDVLICKAIGAVLNGGAGLNTVVMGDDKLKTQILKVGSSWTVTGPTSSATLTDVQRVKLSDTSVALDVDGNAGTTAKVLGAIFGKDYVKNKAFMGIGLDLLDKGTSFETLAGLALGLAGAKSNDEVVTKLWTNIIGSAPSNADKAPFVKMLENGMTAGALAQLAAENSINKSNIDLVGLAKTGIEFTQPVA